MKADMLDDSDISVPVYGPDGPLSTAERDTLKRELRTGQQGQPAREGISAETSGTDLDSTRGTLVDFPTDPEPR